MTGTCPAHTIDDPAIAFYIDAVSLLNRAGIPHLVGGAFAFARHSKIERDTKDLDLFMRPASVHRALDQFQQRGYRIELPFPHWLGKVHDGDYFIDIIFSSGNGIAQVDDLWFEHAVTDKVFGRPMQLCPAEEMIWSKAFVQERERFDGADVLHLFRELGPALDWPRLLTRFGAHWRVLYSYLVLFGFVYPDRRQNIPAWVSRELARRLALEITDADDHVCNGTLLSREQYLVDLERFGYRDGRIEPDGHMTNREAQIWTDAIDTRK